MLQYKFGGRDSGGNGTGYWLLWWWWRGLFSITSDGGLMVVVVEGMMMGALKWTPKAQNILVWLVGIVWL